MLYVGLEVLPRVAGLVEGLGGMFDGGKQVGPVLLARSIVAIENLLHIHRGPRRRLEVRELLVLHLLISKCSDEFGPNVPPSRSLDEVQP